MEGITFEVKVYNLTIKLIEEKNENNKTTVFEANYKCIISVKHKNEIIIKGYYENNNYALN